MHKLTVHNFGPIQHAEIELSRFLLLIGPQSSGKSTVAKLIYFFLHIRDEVTAFILESAEAADQKDTSLLALTKRIRNRFVEFFGPAPQLPDVHIKFSYKGNHFLEITLDKKHHKYVTPTFSNALRTAISDLQDETKNRLNNRQKRPGFISAVGKLASEHERVALLEHARARCNALFGFSKELFFIPAGRSLLSTLSDQVQTIHPHQLDYPMRQFVEAVNATKMFFDRSLDEIIIEKQALSTERLWFSAIRKAQGHVKKVLNGEYRHDKEGGKIYVRPNVFTKISYASSGQQEAVWILLSLFLLVLEKSQALVFIEEPEAHLFPDAQKEIIEFVAFIFNELGCDFLITTHSPYVLSCVNNLLYAHELGQGDNSEKIQAIIAKDRWLPRTNVGGYFVASGKVAPLVSEHTSALKTELLDAVSEHINDQFEALLAVERKVSANEG